MVDGPSRRTLLLGGSAAVVLAAAGAGAATSDRVRGLLHHRPDPARALIGIPDAPEGQVRLETVASAARRRDVGLWTAVPAGHGDGRGLPVCLLLHGGSATTADFSRFGYARFLTAAVSAGSPPFVLAGADGSATGWLGAGPGSADDPQAMLATELPRWCAGRGFDSTRLAAYGWSLGGFGALRGAELRPGTWRAVAALSPAVARGDEVFTDADRLEPARTALWCAESDAFYPAVQALAAALPAAPRISGHAPGGHTRLFWNSVTPAAFAFVGTALAA